MIYLNKILPALVSPLALTLLLLCFGLISKRKWPQYLAVLLLLVFSNPLVGNWAIRWLEREFQPTALERVPELDAVIVLSGMVRPVQLDDGNFRYEFGESIDRFEFAIELFQSGVTPHIIFTQAKLPWGVGKAEGLVLADLAVSRGVPRNAISITKLVQNTDQEALAIKELDLQKSRLGLVTSAFHMRRALNAFEQRQIDVYPIPVDHRGPRSTLTPMLLLPSSQALSFTSLFMREMIGQTYYQVRYRFANP